MGFARPRVRARMVTPRDRDAVLEHLGACAQDNLLLLEMVDGIGRTSRRSDPVAKVVAAYRGDEIVGVVSLRPSIVIDYAITPEGLDACLPSLVAVEPSAIKWTGPTGASEMRNRPATSVTA